MLSVILFTQQEQQKLSLPSFKEGISSNNNQSRPKNIQSGIRGEIKQSPTDRLVNSNGNIEEIAKTLDDTNLDPQTFNTFLHKISTGLNYFIYIHF